jgi:hypothetical protein
VCCNYRDVFAVLEEPPPNLPAVGKPKKVKKKHSGKWAAAEAAASAASMAAATVVRIKALDGLGCSTVCHQVGRDEQLHSMAAAMSHSSLFELVSLS